MLKQAFLPVLMLMLLLPIHPAQTELTNARLFAEQTLDSAQGVIHYSYYLPEDYDIHRAYPLMMVMPGYDMMWFGEESSGSNLNWSGFLSWTQLDEDLIVVSAQLTDWGENPHVKSLN